METTNRQIPEYDQDETFDENIDQSGCRTMVIIITIIANCILAAIIYGIYYFIKHKLLNII